MWSEAPFLPAKAKGEKMTDGFKQNTHGKVRSFEFAKGICFKHLEPDPTPAHSIYFSNRNMHNTCPVILNNGTHL